MEVFSHEEIVALKIFYSAGVEVIERTPEGDLVACVITEKNNGKTILKLNGRILPEEWFPNIEVEKHYYLRDLFGEDKEWL